MVKAVTKPSILVIEDEPDIVELLQYNLEREGFHVYHAGDGGLGIKEALARRPSLVLLDLMLPGLDGLEVCRQLRAKDETRALPIIMLTAKSEESDVVLGLGIGADDYVAKPFSAKEVVARVRSVLRRAQMREENKTRSRITQGALTVDSVRHEVLLEDKPLVVTRAEFRVLWALCSRPGRVFTRNELVDIITAGEAIILDRNVDVHISSIRKKLGRHQDLILTLRGIGYKCAD